MKKFIIKTRLKTKNLWKQKPWISLRRAQTNNLIRYHKPIILIPCFPCLRGKKRTTNKSSVRKKFVKMAKQKACGNTDLELDL